MIKPTILGTGWSDGELIREIIVNFFIVLIMLLIINSEFGIVDSWSNYFFLYIINYLLYKKYTIHVKLRSFDNTMSCYKKLQLAYKKTMPKAAPENTLSLIERIAPSLSIDYAITKQSKILEGNTIFSCKKTLPEKLRSQIIKYNRRNLFHSAILVVGVLCFHTLGVLVKNVFFHWILKSLYLFLFIRIISRTFEIFFSFLVDSVSNNKKSNLESSERIKLSINSYAEIIILNIAVYYTQGVFSLNEEVGAMKTLWNSLFTSVGISTFSDVNFTYTYIEGEFVEIGALSYFMFLQLITSFSLIILSIASYFSKSGK